MANLTTKYLGLILKNPIIIGSSGLTDSVEKIKELEKNGAGAVVIKSLFEEEIRMEIEDKIKQAEEDKFMYSRFSESFDYIDMHVKGNRLDDYTTLIKQAKKEVQIPVIASVNCISSHEWTSFAKQIENAGADALELNIFVLPADINISSEQYEKVYFEIIEKIKKQVNIPVAIKISQYFSNLGQTVNKLSQTGIKGIVMFNRFYSPDFDIENLEVHSASTYSNAAEQYNTLRWIALMSGNVKCDLAASTGIHDSDAVIKQILAGASAVQVVSAVYKHGPDYIVKMLKGLEDWMDKKGYNYIDQFKGKMNQKVSEHSAAFERIQFMKYFSEIK